ncbi:DUF5686 family protein [Pseudopedobacter sp.]|uniref:DUF5686 and carboxypeptidase-like regulatory domain-containing protein n=1 Tax=Pseudopedobacter sp. TaxID=1936787 RepID=UPI003341EEB4
MLRYVLVTLIWSLLGTEVFAQKTIVSGVVKDASTKETIPFANIFFNGTQAGTQTNMDGFFTISTSASYSALKFVYMGYETKIVPITVGKTQRIEVLMNPSAKELKQIVITKKNKAKYSNKDNPAVELIRKVIEHKDSNRAADLNTISYRKYEKMTFSMDNISDKFRNNKLFKNYQFLFQEQDSGKFGGKYILPVYIEEKLSDNFFRKDPNFKKTVIIGEKQAEFDKKYVDNKGLQNYFKRMYEDVDIYSNNISIISNEFLSPIATSAPTFYKYFITDTVKNTEPRLVELSFFARNKGDMLFNGKLYITLDGKYAVKKARLSVDKDINLNFVRGMNIDLDFESDENNLYNLNKSHLSVDFGINKEKGFGFIGDRSVTFRNYEINKPLPDSVFKEEKITAVEPKPVLRNDNFWNENRLDTISHNQLSIYKNIDSLQTIPSFRRTVKYATLLIAGYQNLGGYDMGPFNTFYSFNNVEGFRLRVGGRTTTELSKNWYFENYLAYGVKDEKWKYYLSGAYAFNHKSIYTFPQHFIKVSFQRDTKIPGQELQFIQEDNILLSFKRGVNDMLLYNDFYKIEYIKEFENHFSYGLQLKKWSQSPAGGLYYQTYSENFVNRLTTSEVSLSLRYAPHEKFYQGKVYRTSFVNKYPIFNLRYSVGLRNVLGGEYDYHSLSGSIDKRFYLSQFGYSDVRTEGAYMFGKLPFPLLSIHRANQTYAYQMYAYNLMNFLEFVSDRYVSLNIDHNFNGFFLNKIPLVKHLKLREIVSFKALYGGLRAENNPNLTGNTYRFPLFADGQSRTYSLGNEPYMEGSIGLGNIFKVLRVDAVKRFNYLNHPEVSEWGVRARVKFDF